jgi:polyferredoxin/tetratricopeptide (TPR) repeat protein
VSLPVKSGTISHGPVKKSKMGKWRFGVLILVHVVMIAHILQWLYHGVTVSPVEPSESMYTLEAGELNAGFIMFCLAIIATLVFGRFFCGWACHMIALQDACTVMMNRIGVRPKQFRSRLLVWSGLLLALYMFVWPTFKREVLSPVSRWMAEMLGTWFIGDFLNAPALKWVFADAPRGFPYPLGADNAFPGMTNSLIVEDFWATFPPWYVAIPFLIVCGFVTVYFLGNKGFCTYGCPYGGFFAPVDRYSVGRIVVNDKCEGCGHCTAVCTSNVRVHQEVRDFGQVMDVGCMKCLDCVCVCPNDALSFKIAKPAFLVKPRTEDAKAAIKAGRVRRPEYDLTVGEEFAVFGLAFILIISFRGMFNEVPLLMAMSMGAIGAFCAWTSWRMVTTPNVRLQSLQLRVKGRTTRAGFVFAILTVVYLAIGAWSGVVRANRAIGDYLDQSILTSQAAVFAPNYTPEPGDKAQALRAISFLERGGLPASGGIGWNHSPATYTRLAWLHAVAGDRARAEMYIKRATEVSRPGPALVSGIATIFQSQGRTAQEYEAFLKTVLERFPDGHHVRVALANLYWGNNRRPEAQQQVDAILADVRGADDDALVSALGFLARTGQAEKALEKFPEVLRLKPTSASLRGLRGAIAMVQNRPDEAETWLREAIERAPRNPQYHLQLAQTLAVAGKQDEATEALERLNRVYESIDEPQNVMVPAERLKMLMGR